MFAFAGTIATWIDDDWNLVERVIGFNQIDRHEHTGSGSARVIFEAMRNIGSASKMSMFCLFGPANADSNLGQHAFSLTLDNVSSNTVLSRIVGNKLMELYGVPFHPNNSHIRCLAHVVNLVVQKMLSVAKEVDDPEFQDYYEQLNKQFPVHYDLASDEELRDFESEEDDRSKAQVDLSDGLVDQDSGEQDHFAGMGAIEKVRSICTTL